MSTNKEIAKKLFEEFPGETEVHFTSDGTNFFNVHNATLHAKNQKSQEVTTIKKADLDNEEPVKMVKLKLTKAILQALPQLGETAKEGDTIEVTKEQAEEYKEAAKGAAGQ